MLGVGIEFVILVFERSNIVRYSMACCIALSGSAVVSIIELVILLLWLMWSLKCRHESAWSCCEL
jgi:hypothetical protein